SQGRKNDAVAPGARSERGPDRTAIRAIVYGACGADFRYRNSASRRRARMACSSLGSRPRGIQPWGIGTGPMISRGRLVGNWSENTARPPAWRSGLTRSSSSLYTSTLTDQPPPGAGLIVTLAKRRID